MFTDMVGYSQQMQKDEGNALKLLEKQWEIVEPILQEFGGKRIKTIGDAFYTQFHSVLKALKCALEVQQILSSYNATRHFEEHVTLRIGIHLGDIEIKDGDAYGDGVNIAARIEPLAEPGGIAITEDVHRQVVNKIEYSFKPLGKPELKNIHQRFEVYQVILPWQDRRKKQDPNFTVDKDRRRQSQMHSKTLKNKNGPKQSTSRPVIYGVMIAMVIMATVFLYKNNMSSLNRELGRSIAVLPFENMTEQPGSDYFSDGITEDIISALSEINGLRVIARTSILQYKGTNKTVVEIAKEVNVNTILEGSVRRIDNNVRVVAQLIDIETDDHLWANTYDRKLDDIFEVQSDIALNIANALEAELSTELTAELTSSSTQNSQAYENYLKGKEQYYTYTEEGFRKAVKYYNSALELDPNYALAYAELAGAYAQLYNTTKEVTFKDIGFKSVEKAVSINPELAEAYKARGVLNAYTGQGIKALEDYLKAVNLKPGYSDVIANIGYRYFAFGDLSECYNWQKKAHALNPNHRFNAWYHSIPLFIMNENESAIEILNNDLEKIKDSFEMRAILFYFHANNGDYKKAKSMLDELSKVRSDDKRIFELRGLYHLMQGEHEEGVRMMALASYPTEYSQLLLAQAYFKLKDKNKGEEILKNIEKESQALILRGSPSYHPSYKLAQVNALRGDYDIALGLLEDAIGNGFRGYAHEDNFISWLVNPIFSDLRQNSRFIMLQKRMEKIIQRERVEAGFLNQAS
jgi:TolB-like protein/class 3 adenylate cyclase/Tfp pilus assembly protein PilF